MVVAQLVERSLPTPEVHRSNPDVGKHLYWTFDYCQLYWKDGNKEKQAGNGPFKKEYFKQSDWRLNFFTNQIDKLSKFVWRMMIGLGSKTMWPFQCRKWLLFGRSSLHCWLTACPLELDPSHLPSRLLSPGHPAFSQSGFLLQAFLLLCVGSKKIWGISWNIFLLQEELDRA